jgi:hypothetical protein
MRKVVYLIKRLLTIWRLRQTLRVLSVYNGNEKPREAEVTDVERRSAEASSDSSEHWWKTRWSELAHCN